MNSSDVTTFSKFAFVGLIIFGVLVLMLAAGDSLIKSAHENALNKRYQTCMVTGKFDADECHFIANELYDLMGVEK